MIEPGYASVQARRLGTIVIGVGEAMAITKRLGPLARRYARRLCRLSRPLSVLFSSLFLSIIDLAAVRIASSQHSVPGNAALTSPNLSGIYPHTS